MEAACLRRARSEVLPELRARRALSSIGLQPNVAIEAVESVNNEVWMTDELVVRVSCRPDQRLRREAQLSQILPQAVGYPPVLGYGAEMGSEWLVLGRITYTPNMHMMLSPIGNANYEANGKQPAGKLGYNMLAAYDLDLDYRRGVLNIFSPDRCPYVPPAGTAVVAIEFDKSGFIRVPVKLDGVEISAVLGTGLPITTLNQSLAEDALAVKMSAADVKSEKVGSITVYRKTFKTLDFGGFVLNAPVVNMMPDVKGRNITRRAQNLRVETETVIITQDDPGRSLAPEDKMPDMTIGANALKGLHLYIATKEKKLYILPAGAAP